MPYRFVKPGVIYSPVPEESSIEDDLAPYIEAEWHFDDRNDRLWDYSGHGHHGTVTGDAVWEGGQIGMSLKTDGSGSYVELGATNLISIADNVAWTVEVLLFTPDLNGQSAFPGIHGNTYSGGAYSRLYFDVGISRLRWSGDSNNFTNVGNADMLLSDREVAVYHVVCDGSQIASYKNGTPSSLGWVVVANTSQTIRRLCCIGHLTTYGWNGKTMFMRVYVNTYLTERQVRYRHEKLIKRMEPRIIEIESPFIPSGATSIPVFMRTYRNMRT